MSPIIFGYRTAASGARPTLLGSLRPPTTPDGPDMPFVPDFRGGGEPPVRYLPSWGDRWVTVAESVAGLAARCGL